MNRMNANAVAIDNVRHMATPTEDHELTWFQRRLADTGVIMALTNPKLPPGFFVNWTSVTSIIVVVGAIASLWWFTWSTAEQRGIEKGRLEAEKQQMQKQMDEQARKIAETERLLKLAVTQEQK